MCNDLYRAELLTIVRAFGCKHGQNRDLKSQLFRVPALLFRRIGKSVLNSTDLLSIFVLEPLLFRDYSKTKRCSSLTRVEIRKLFARQFQNAVKPRKPVRKIKFPSLLSSKI